MDLSMADQYYLRAADDYPFCMESVLENLNYALGYDDDHAQANCLLGVIYMMQLKDYERAEQSFVRAMQGDMDFPDPYKYYALLKIWKGEYEAAERAIRYGLKVKGMDIATMYVLKAMVCEYRGELKLAGILLGKARQLSFDEVKVRSIDVSLNRIRMKLRNRKRRG